MAPDLPPDIFARYLRLVGVPPGPPTLDLLRRLVRAHLERVQFENVSKLHYLRTRGLRGVPSLPEFLDGIEHLGFGGTCYSSNPHFGALLAHLGYPVALCGADMEAPDLHTALLVRADGGEFLVDVGYGAPFYEPAPRGVASVLETRLGNERWVVEPADAQGCTRVVHERGGQLVHGYRVKPTPRSPDFFRSIIEGSFAPAAHFMRCVRLVRFRDDGSVSLSNLTLMEARGERVEIRTLSGRAELLETIEARFGIPRAIAGPAIAQVPLGPCASQ